MVPSLISNEAVAEAAIKCGIPKKFVRTVMAGEISQNTPAIRAILEAELAGKSMVALSGGVGCGKSAAAARYAIGAIRRARTTMWLQAWHLSRLSAFDAEVFTRYTEAPVLVIDDIGAEYQDEKGFWMMMLGGIINDRYDNDATMTILTTNLSGPRFKERYGERISDRIREIGVFAELPNGSLRRKP